MKSKTFTLSLFAFLISSVSFAKIWRVNNNAGVSANFTTAQAAVSSASVVNGDTLHFEGNSVSYGDISDLNKSLVLIGAGYYLNNWTSPVQFNPNSAKIDNISKISALNVQLIGIEFSSVYLYSSNFQMSRCLVNSALYLYGTSNNVAIRQNWIGSIYGSGAEVVTNLILSNNLISSYIYFYGGNDNGIIEYNNFGVSGYTSLNLGDANFSFRNNIIVGASSGFGNFANSSVEYNMAEGNLLPAGFNNQNNVSMTGNAVFVNNSYVAPYNDKNFMLSTNSPAKTAGAGGTPIGSYASTNSYIPSGIPPIPTIYSLSLPSATATGSTIQVTFSSKSNN